MAADSNKSSATLFKNRSWSPSIHRDVEWEMLKVNQRLRYRRSKSLDAASDIDVTDDDIKELRACFELGFGFDPSSDLDPKLVSAFPALELYADVNRQFNNQNLSRSSSIESDFSSNSDASSNLIVDPNDDPQKVKTRLKLWALVVACSIRKASLQSATEVTA
ncbi:hypothetical protein L6452_28169 [Arctium lappa]|uniref:Uncharacterized protein n=1 Tax=Arctium lappa TaxID=4217 RepID=A0ACB8ZYP0_ARCLA|nr:hypothetical protein L6452_28169 [Arctium lappa]